MSQTVCLTNMKMIKKVFAVWEDIKHFYEFDVKNNSCRLVRKIDHDHTYPENDKMKVSLASQIFSKTLGSIMLFCSKHHLVSRDYSGMPEFCTTVAPRIS